MGQGQAEGRPVPSAPWVLAAEAVASLGLVRAEVARRQTPAPLEVASVLPGLTPGGFVLLRYTASPVGPYHELLALVCLARYGRHLGFHVGRAWVDSPLSMAGGRELWGLPKEMASFEWRRSDNALRAAATAGVELASADVRMDGPAIPVAGLLPCLSVRGGRVLAWGASGSAEVHLAAGRVEPGAASPLRELAPSLTLPTLVGSAPALLVRRPRMLDARTR